MSGKGSRASLSARTEPLQDETPRVPRPQDGHINLDLLPTSPPSSFTPARRAKKRTSDEFEMDQHGSLISKRTGYGSGGSDKATEEKGTSARKHRSLNVSTSSITSPRDGKTRDRRRESLGLSLSTVSKLVSSTTKTPERHSRQLSAGSVSSTLVDGRRIQTTDFSHLPPSPASSSIQHLLKQSVNKSHTPPLSSSSRDNLSQLTSPSVAHSLLRGTQEGWSALDDEATAEALRKLDGLTGKTARARASVGSFGRASSSSRPVTPAKAGNQWEGIGGDHVKSRKPSSVSTGSEKEGKDVVPRHHSLSGSVDTEGNFEGLDDDQSQSLPQQDKTPKKVSVRMSFTPKRTSASSTYTNATTASSRDPPSTLNGTGPASVPPISGRHSASKTRRNSAGSDISSGDANFLKDRVASIAVIGDTQDNPSVPPVPPLPKDLSSYRSPPPTSSGLSFPSLSGSEDAGKLPRYDSNLGRASFDVPALHGQVQSHKQDHQHATGHISTDSGPAPKTPSKKWSFSSALNLRLSSSPNSKSSFPLSPRAVSFGHQLRKSTSKDKGASKSPWSPKQPDAMTSAGSLTSLSSVGSVHAPGMMSGNSRTPDRGVSRPGTSSSASTNHTTSALSAPPIGPLSPSSSVRRTHSKRLTPSSIPFFRRSSSQSMQIPPIVPPSTSPPSHLSTPRSKNGASPSRDYAALSTSVPSSASKKSSVLSLGLPSLLKSSSRRSLHSDAKESARSDKEAEKARVKAEKEKKKEEKDRSESRISLMIRKRGKVK